MIRSLQSIQKQLSYLCKKLVSISSIDNKISTIVTSLLGVFTRLYSIYANNKTLVEYFTRAADKEFVVRISL